MPVTNIIVDAHASTGRSDISSVCVDCHVTRRVAIHSQSNLSIYWRVSTMTYKPIAGDFKFSHNMESGKVVSNLKYKE